MALLCALAAGCGRDPAENLGRQAPGLTEEMVRCLDRRNDDFATCCSQHPPDWLLQAYGAIVVAYEMGTVESFRRSATILDPPCRKLLECLGVEHGFTRFAATKIALLDLPPERALAARALIGERNSILQDESAGSLERLNRLRDLAERIHRFGPPLDASHVSEAIANVLLERGDVEAAIASLRVALAEAQGVGHYNFVCQQLGVLGEYHLQAGRVDSMRACWDRALSTATTYGLAGQAARLTSFYAAFYRDAGRFAIAEDLFRDAEETYRDLGGRQAEIRYLLDTLKFQASLGCWEAVRRGLRSAPAVLRSCGDDTPDTDRYTLEIEVLRARCDFARDEVEAADARFHDVEPRAKGLARRAPSYPAWLHEWAAGLLRHDRARTALEVSQRAIAYCESLYIPEWLAPQTILAAQAQFALGDRQGCRASLQRFVEEARQRAAPLSAEWIAHDALRVRLARADGDLEATVGAVHEGLERLGRELERADPSPGAYLVHAVRHDMRQVIREIAADDVALSYAVETWFRQAVSSIGRPPAAASAAESPLRSMALDVEAHLRLQPPVRARAHLGSMQVALGERRAIHLLFEVDGDRVTRWTVTAHSIRREDIEEGRELRVQVERVATLLATDPASEDAVPNTEEVALLAQLGQDLLPAEVRAPTGAVRPALVLVTTDRWLDLVPFEALDVRGTHYEPLLAEVDVVRLRPTTPAARRPATGRGLIVCDPALSATLQRRHPALVPLAAGRLEASSLHAFDPSARLLGGSEARKSAIVSSWERAKFLYLASHVVRDGGTPYTSFVPLASSESEAASDDHYLELADVLRARFDGCRLVVLSACATGRPYVGEDTEAPSLGSAFLDRGAAAVIETSWPVRDDLAARLMTEFVSRWAGAGEPPVTALGAARRSALRGPRGLRHPFSWAGYRVAVRSVTEVRAAGH